MSRKKQTGNNPSADGQAAGASEAKYRTLFDSIDEGFVIAELLFDEAGKPFDLLVLETNASFDRMMQTMNAVGKRALEIFPNAEASWFEVYGRVVETGESQRFENYLAALDRWFDLYISRIGEADDHRFAIVFNDITERKHVQERVRQSEEQLRIATRAARMATFEIDIATGKASFDDNGAELYGSLAETESPQDWMAHVQTYLDPTDAQRQQERLLSTMRGEGDWHDELRARDLSTGKVTWVEVYATLVRDRDGQPHRVVGIVRDISERKRHEADLAFLDQVSEGLVHWTNIEETMGALGQKIGAHFNVPLVAFAEVDEAQEVVTVNHAWNRPDLPSLRGMYRISDFHTEDFRQASRAGETYVVRDVATDPRTNAERMAALNIASLVSVPLLRKGQWCFQLTVFDTAPRDWRDDEIELMRELTTRIWTRLERSRAEEELHRSEERLRLIVESAKGYAIFTTDAGGFINSWNLGAADIFGWSEAEILGQPADVMFTPEDRAAGEPQKELETARTQGIAPDIRWHQRKDGSRVFINGEVRPLRDGQPNGFFKIGRDLTAQRQAEEALREHQKQLQMLTETLEQKVQEKTLEVRRLASDVINATQRERQRISRVLHDDLQQRVFALQMQLSFLSSGLPSEYDAAQQEVSAIEKELAGIVKMTRNLSIDLSPPILPEEGLSHAIEWLASRMRELYGLPVELQANDSFLIPNEELHVLLFNCVRELLFNVVKHAEASRAIVALHWLDHGLRIEVRDDGRGFSNNIREEAISKRDNLPRSLGLPTIRQELSLFGGTVEITSAPGTGTQVALIVPLAEAPPQGSSPIDTA